MALLSTRASGTEQDIGGGRALARSGLIAATPAQVYEGFVSEERWARWWGPNGLQNTFQVFEVRPGGGWQFVMHGPNGKDYPNESKFERLVFGGAGGHPPSVAPARHAPRDARSGGQRHSPRLVAASGSQREFEAGGRMADRLETELARSAPERG